jgi:CheY-like chemotaxis protein
LDEVFMDMTEGLTNILIIENNRDVAERLAQAFKHKPQVGRVEVVEDGETALNQLFAGDSDTRSSADNLPQLIFLGLTLPTMSGQAVLSTLKAAPQTRAIPVVVLSETCEPSVLTTIYTLGATSSLCKDQMDAAALEVVATYWISVMTLDYA